MLRYASRTNSNADCSSSPHFHFAFFSVRCPKGVVIDENFGMNNDRNAAILTDERMDFQDSCRGIHETNSVNLYRVRFHSISREDKPKEIYFTQIKKST